MNSLNIQGINFKNIKTIVNIIENADYKVTIVLNKNIKNYYQ